MEKLRALYRYLRKQYDILSLKKYTTVAGTLVFFLIMSIVPLSFWITLLVGKLPIQAEQVLSLPVFDSVKEVLLYVQREAENATAGASILLILTTLYSSTNLFYQMRRSGEIIYDYHKKRQGFRVRLGAFLLLLIVMAAVIIFLLLFALGSFLFTKLLSPSGALIADYFLLIGIAFLLVFLLNMYICPFQANVRCFLPGTFLTVLTWGIAVIGFSLYLKISNVSRLYGALSVIIVFLLWLYVMMICFIVGVIFNSENVSKWQEKNKKKG